MPAKISLIQMHHAQQSQDLYHNIFVLFPLNPADGDEFTLAMDPRMYYCGATRVILKEVHCAVGDLFSEGSMYGALQKTTE